MTKKILGPVALLLCGLLCACSSVKTSSSEVEKEDTTPSSSEKENSDTSKPDDTKPDDNKPDDNKDTSENDGLNENNLANNPQDGTIFHAWSWPIRSIIDALPAISEAGFSTIQTSPMQPQKDFYNNDHINSWWKLYQPLGLCVASKNNAIGTKNDLKDLCTKADQYGVKIIVDVVANHLAGGNKESFHGGVREYESEIYNKKLFHTGVGMNSDSDPKKVTRGNIGDFPDLKTEDPIVQNAVKDLLIEYVDLGVDGFRFDAAKHIETPDDIKGVASPFWDTVLNGAKDYAISKGKDAPYYYGEILHTVGAKRTYESYTKRMSVTDSDASSDILKGVKNKNLSKVAIQDIYKDGVEAHDAILWGESHDTYANRDGESRNTSQENVNLAYAIASSRNQAASLYFVRPDNNMRLGQPNNNTSWKNPLIKNINQFHNYFMGSKESFDVINKDTYLAYKEKGIQTGVMVVNVGNSFNLNIDTLGAIGDGTYSDKVSNSTFEVKNGILTGKMNNSGVACLYSKGEVIPPSGDINPSIRVSNDGSTPISDATDITIITKNSTKSTYQINEDTPVEFKDEVKITLDPKDYNGDEIKLKVVAKNDKKEVSQTFTYKIIKGDKLNPLCINLPIDIINNKKIGVWVWNERNNSSSRWVEGVMKNDTVTFNVKSDDTHFILATFNLNSKIDWSNKVKQTENIPLGKSLYDASEFSWK